MISYTSVRLVALLGVVFLTPIGAQTEPSEDLGHGYTRQGEFVLFEGKRIDEAGREDIADFARYVGKSLRLCDDVDAPSFVALSEQYTKDRAMVYYKWISPGKFWVVQLPDADVETFESIGFNLARDKDHVWWYGAILPNLDPRTFEMVREGFVWKDARQVWYQHEPIAGADPATFEHLARAFYRDARRVYWATTPLTGADPRTVRTFGDESAYAADARSVWWAENRLEGPHAPSFEPIHRAVFRDRRGVYERPGQPIEGADTNSFRKDQDLDQAGTALFWDARFDYVYTPYRGEVFRVRIEGNALSVTRTIWSGRENPKKRATAKTRLTEEGWSAPTITLEGGGSSRKIASQEADFLERRRELFERVWKILQDRPRQGGDQR